MEDIDLSSRNSFLNETDRISVITSSIRKEIDDRFCKSRVNKKYVFPRTKKNSREIVKSESVLLQEKLTRLFVKRQKSNSSVFISNQSFTKLPELRKKITMKMTTKNIASNNNLNSSLVFDSKSNNWSLKEIGLSRKKRKIKVK